MTPHGVAILAYIKDNSRSKSQIIHRFRSLPIKELARFITDELQDLIDQGLIIEVSSKVYQKQGRKRIEVESIQKAGYQLALLL